MRDETLKELLIDSYRVLKECPSSHAPTCNVYYPGKTCNCWISQRLGLILRIEKEVVNAQVQS